MFDIKHFYNMFSLLGQTAPLPSRIQQNQQDQQQQQTEQQNTQPAVEVEHHADQALWV